MTTGIFSQILLWLPGKGDRESITLPEHLHNSFVIFMLTIFVLALSFFFFCFSFLFCSSYLMQNLWKAYYVQQSETVFSRYSTYKNIY